MKIDKYFNLCEQHDWYYEMGDHDRFKQGNAQKQLLLRNQKHSEMHKKCYEDWFRYM